MYRELDSAKLSCIIQANLCPIDGVQKVIDFLIQLNAQLTTGSRFRQGRVLTRGLVDKGEERRGGSRRRRPKGGHRQLCRLQGVELTQAGL
jgi:hypothetical protein